MEVHAHTHTARKKWTHYFWEFLMLFLAVFCGFLAEYKLEHMIEHQRERKFANLLYQDLKKDSSLLNETIRAKKWRQPRIDSLLLLLSQPDLEKNASSIYFYGHSIFINIPFKPYDATIQQLRNSGSMRYFSKPELYNSIIAYYADCTFYQELEAGLKKEMLIPIASKILDASKFYGMINLTPDYTRMINEPVGPMKLLSSERGPINDLVFYTNHVKMIDNISLIIFQTKLSLEQKDLINKLKQAYHF